MRTKTATEGGDLRLLTYDEVTDLTGVSKATISRACTSGALKCVRFGRHTVRIPAEALAQFIDAGGISTDGRARKHD